MTPREVQALVHDGLRQRMYQQQTSIQGAGPAILSVTEVGAERLAVVFGDSTVATVKITVHKVQP